MVLRRWLSLAVISVLAAMTFGQVVLALDVPPAPSLDRPIVDQTKTLDDEQIDKLSSIIAEGRRSKSYQIGVLIIPELKDESIEGYSIKVARSWGIGESQKDNGVLLLIAKNDRQLRIEVGDGLEGDLTDLESGQIIRGTITPKFKSGKYYEGIRDGIESIQANVEGKADPHQSSTSSEGFWGVVSMLLYFVVFGFVWLASVLGRSKSWWAGGVIGGVIGLLILVIASAAVWSIGLLVGLIAGGLGLDYLVSKNYRENVRRHGKNASWWAGGGFGGGGSSSGGSFGGGGFSGGGSSGSW